MLGNFHKSKQMEIAAEFTEETRQALRALVERERRRTGSLMVAYENVAAMIGASSSYIQKFLAKDPIIKEPRITLFLNIRAAYDSLCERVEMDNRSDERRLRARQGRLNAAFKSSITQSEIEG